MDSNWIRGSAHSVAELSSRFNIPKDEVTSFQKYLRIYPKGSVIIREGETDITLFLLRYGTVTVYKQINREKRELVGEIEAVNFFGEMSIFNEEPRSATVEALSDDVLVVAVDRPNIDLILSFPHWGEMLISRLSKNLASTNNQLSDSFQMIAQLKREKASLKEQIQQAEDYQIEHLVNVARVFSGLIRFQRIIQDEAIVGARGWTYLKALNNITLLLIKNYIPEIIKYRKPADIEMLRVCVSQLEGKVPKNVYNYLLASLPD